jgi:hypothetical protein
MNGKAYPYEKDGVIWGFGHGQCWPPGFDAQVVVDQFEEYRGVPRAERPYLSAGQVVTVLSDEGDHLFVESYEPAVNATSIESVHKSHVEPVANSLS